jgi:hypothetical protein
VAYALQLWDSGAPIAVGAAVFVVAVFAIRGALGMIVRGELGLVLRSAFTLPEIEVEGDGIDDGRASDSAASVIYCHRDGRVNLIARPPARVSLLVAQHPLQYVDHRQVRGRH